MHTETPRIEISRHATAMARANVYDVSPQYNETI